MVSISVQKKIMVVPYINILNLFIFSYNCVKADLTVDLMIKAALCFCVYTIPAQMITMLLYNLFPHFQFVIGLLGSYLVPLSMSYGIIRFQEKHFSK